MSYQAIALRVLGECSATGWTLRDGETWCMVTPPRHVPRQQGWKLHLSATPASAARVLESATRILVAHECAFKFAVSPRVTAELTSVRAPRAQSGKFLTVYPLDDDQLRVLTGQLHEATLGLAGPAILSDRRYRPDSLVHYRYGCFARPRELSDEGLYEGRLQAPDGTFVADERNPWFSPPPWARPPFEPPVRTAAGRRRGAPVLIAGRYLVREAVRHSNRGGVYRAYDRRTGADVLLKEARPHIGATSDGKDARYWLRYEADVLEQLAPLRITPAVRDVFESAGHVFLVEDLIDGKSLQRWTTDGIARDDHGLIPVTALWKLARELTHMIGRMHAAGFVVRDLKPGNIVMTPHDTPVLVDMECAVRADERAHVVGTHGFTAPEYLGGPDRDDDTPPPAPGPEVDCYSLGATLLYAATGIIPLLADDSPPRRTAGDRLAEIVDTAAPAAPALRALAPLVIGLTADGPARWPLEKAAAFLRATPAEAPVSAGPAPARGALDRLLADGLAHLAATAEPDAEHLWPPSRSAPHCDPCNVQLGAAGVLAVLDRAVRSGETTAEPVLWTAAQWLDRRLTSPSRILPGLYFGRSGTVWALHDAARTLSDPGMADRAVEYALRIPLDWHNPDICHGLAGAGLAQLHLWRATGDPRFADRASECADGLVRLTTGAEHGVDWPVGPEHRRELAGSALYGFGHGVAGNAAFLLAAGRDLGRPELLDIATGAGHALCAVAEPRGDAAVWPKGPGRTERTDLNFWCHGASGIGTFLVRLWTVTGDARFREYADRAARAVYRDRCRIGPSTCHGAAGNAELLLDLADATGEEHYRTWATEIATCLYARAVRRDGRLLVPDDTLRDVSAGYNVGSAGVLDFLLRLTHGGNRSWLVDPR
ncbi:class IV lanthionine synthetase LanL [Streptomyces netropsis]|uniref:Serine/threonine protein kinase n=1 Tax=Streptomyces netropsis TaxID=55404 RepID=A0A7W7LGS6_STRNE|nr:class IV lanthionine synthetase LanL [Streptomyces netropsis]MBB4889276.1 serine/threonine protein kinase [Streptomyces netropsis]